MLYYSNTKETKVETKILQPNLETYTLAKSLIEQGKIVAFPTETVYGLGADATNPTAVEKIFLAKGRPNDNPLIVHLGDKRNIQKYVLRITPLEQKIIDAFMPGPISLVLPKNSLIPDCVTAKGPTVAIRIPENQVARDLINFCQKPICAPSANTSKRPSPTIAQHVFQDMNGKIPLIIDGGQTDVGIKSTVVKVEKDQVFILRPGKIDKTLLENTLHCPVHENTKVGKIAQSPGMKYTHYKPNCDMILVKTNPIVTIPTLYQEYTKQGKNVIIFCKEDDLPYFSSFHAVSLGKDSEEASHNLFKMLREYEDHDLILAQFVDNGKMVEGLFNRMSRACSGHIV